MNKNLQYSLAALGIANAQTKSGIYLANEDAHSDSYLSQPLTDYIVGYLPSQQPLLDLLEFVAPEVRAPRRFEFKKSDSAIGFVAAENDEDVRALYGEFKRIQTSGTIEQSKTLSKGLSMLLDTDLTRDDPLAEETAARQLTLALIRAEILRAILILNAAGTNAPKTWSSGADADVDLLDALTAGGDAAGLDPNRVLFGATAWQRRLKGLRALDTAGGFASAHMSQDDLAGFLAVDSVRVASERYQVGKGKSQLVTSNLVLLFNALSGATAEDPSNIKRFVTLKDGGQYKVTRREVASELVEITVSHYSNIVLTSSAGVRKITVS